MYTKVESTKRKRNLKKVKMEKMNDLVNGLGKKYVYYLGSYLSQYRHSRQYRQDRQYRQYHQYR